MINQCIKDTINSISNYFSLGDITHIEKLESNQNNVYKINTSTGIYVIKEFSSDAISNYYYLKKRKKQIKVSCQLKEEGINCLIPIKVKDKYFLKLNQKYYLVYDFLEDKIISEKELTIFHIHALAKLQSKMHKLNLSSNLPCTYKQIKIDFDKYLKSFKDDKYLFDTLLKRKNVLNELIYQCNYNLNKVKNNLCISHNDFKLRNILWNNFDITLIDFDAMALVNPTCALCESAFTFSKINNEINYKFYEEYLKIYLEDYDDTNEDFKRSLYVCMNGKLRWLEYLLSKKRSLEIISMIEELVSYYNNIDNFYNIYLKVKN